MSIALEATAPRPKKSKAKKQRVHPVHAQVIGEPDIVLVFAPADIARTPAREDPSEQLFVCPSYNHADADSCPAGDRCPHLHGDPERARRFVRHRRETWTTAKDVPQALLLASIAAAPRTLTVAEPNTKEATVDISTEECLLTKAFESDREPKSLCAHFKTKGVCDLGAECQFIHFLDSTCDQAEFIPSAEDSPCLPQFTEQEVDAPMPRVRRFRHDPYDISSVFPAALLSSASVSHTANRQEELPFLNSMVLPDSHAESVSHGSPCWLPTPLPCGQARHIADTH